MSGALDRLGELAGNLWWSWNPAARELFSSLDDETWKKCSENPIAFLENVPAPRIEEMSRDKTYMERCGNVMAQFDGYMNDTRSSLPLPEGISASRPVAFFSMEFGVHAVLPLYAGGLGVLAGDYLKSASDMNLPVVGVGLLYGREYSGLPIEPVEDSKRGTVSVSVDLPGRNVRIVIWKARVGRVSLYLLGTNAPENSPEDRGILDHIYAESRQTRIEQEVILGIGGVRALAKLGLAPSLYHINEGHTGFLLIERCRALMGKEGLSLAQAMEVVRASSVLTIHTPAQTGNEIFAEESLAGCLRDRVEEMGMDWQDFWCLGRDEGAGHEGFVMTVFALKLANRSNAVSRVHGAVSREMWKRLWDGFPPAEIPITHIRNGIHRATWAGPEMGKMPTASGWDKIEEIPDEELWQAHNAQKRNAIKYIKEVIIHDLARDLSPDVLTMVWARRFAPYKRPALILTDKERLLGIVNHPEMPVQIIIAGRSHPHDPDGCRLVSEVADFCRAEGATGRIVFLGDYNLHTARHLVQAADVWLNTPIRRMEASGTSGQKAAINGCLNLSILDGWWEEAYDGSNGWAIAEGERAGDRQSRDEADAESLYTMLEGTVVPMYYERNPDSVPERWVKLIKNSIRTIAPVFNTDRMISEYFEEMYAPSAKRAVMLSKDQCEGAGRLAEWKRDIPARFSSAGINNVSVTGIEDDTVTAGSDVNVEVEVDTGDLSPGELLVEMVLFNTREGDSKGPPLTVKMDPDERIGDGRYLFRGYFKPVLSGRYSHSIRIMPYHRYLGSKQELGLVHWSG